METRQIEEETLDISKSEFSLVWGWEQKLR